MNLIRKGHGHAHRGIIGVESAIVMIAFVIVAAALAFVVLNMGFSTTQKAKTTIISSLAEASTALQVSGKVMGIACTDVAVDPACSTSLINSTTFPIKIASGGNSINLEEGDTAVKYLSNTVEYTDILECVLSGASYKNVTLAFAAANNDADCTAFGVTGNTNPINGTLPVDTRAILYWTVDSNSNSIIDSGEHMVLAIGYNSGDRPAGLDKIRMEILLSVGSALTVERQIPNITNLVVDMG